MKSSLEGFMKVVSQAIGKGIPEQSTPHASAPPISIPAASLKGSDVKETDDRVRRRVKILDVRQKAQWTLPTYPGDKVLVIGDSNMRPATNLPPGWRLYV